MYGILQYKMEVQYKINKSESELANVTMYFNLLVQFFQGTTNYIQHSSAASHSIPSHSCMIAKFCEPVYA
jgi:hypothetical protein